MSEYQNILEIQAEPYLAAIWDSWRSVIDGEVESLLAEGVSWGEAVEQACGLHSKAIFIEAIDLADEADEKKRRSEAAEEDRILKADAVEEAAEAAKAIVESCGCTMQSRRSSGSLYFWISNDDESILFSVRISDHYGRGWSEAKQCCHEAPNVNIVVEKQRDGAYEFDLSSLQKELGIKNEI